MSGLQSCFFKNSWQAALALQHLPSFPPFLEFTHQASTLLFPNFIHLTLSGLVRSHTACSSSSQVWKFSLVGGGLSRATGFLDMPQDEEGMEAAVTCSHGGAIYPCIASPCNWAKPVQISVVGLQREYWSAFNISTITLQPHWHKMFAMAHYCQGLG